MLSAAPVEEHVRFAKLRHQDDDALRAAGVDRVDEESVPIHLVLNPGRAGYGGVAPEVHRRESFEGIALRSDIC